MSKAKASIECITGFKSSVEQVGNAAEKLASSTDCIDSIIGKANQEKAKIEKAEGTVKGAIERGNVKKEKLNTELGALCAEISTIPPTVTETVTCGKDAEGNDIVKEVEKPNPIYIALMNRISAVKSQIASVEALIGQLRSHLDALSNTKQAIDTSVANLKNQKSIIDSECATVNTKSASASSQLTKAITAIHNYLGVKVSMNPVPSHTTIAWTSYDYSPTSTAGASSGRTNRRSQLTKHEIATIQQSLGAKVTVLSGGNGASRTAPTGGGAATDGARSASGGKRWSQTTFEQDVSFTYKGEKKTVHMKRKVHQINDPIDYDYPRPDGKTNREAMMEGKSPLVVVKCKNGKEVLCPLDLHHMTQQENINSPWDEYTQGTMLELPSIMHKKYNKQIHMQYKKEKGIRRSFRVKKNNNHKWEVSEEAKQFETFKKDYWRWRVMQHDARNS